MKHCISCLIYYFLYPRWWLFLCSGRFECEESPLPSRVLALATLSWLRVINLVPRAFPSKIFFRGKSPGDEVAVWYPLNGERDRMLGQRTLLGSGERSFFVLIYKSTFVSPALYHSLRPCLYAETSRLEGSPVYPSYSVRATTTKRGELFTWETKSWLGSPFCGGRVTLLAGSIFLHINSLVRPAGKTRSKLAQGETIRARASDALDN